MNTYSHKKGLLQVNMSKVLVLSTIIMCVFSHNVSAQMLNVYYKSDKAYVDARINGLSPASKDGKFGFVNTKGKYIIPAVFDEVESFQNDLSVVKYNNKWGLIDLRGNTIIDPICEEKPTTLTYNGNSNVIRCNVFESTYKQKKYASLYYKNGESSVIEIKEHRNVGGNILIVSGDADQSLENKGGFGESYMINSKGDLYVFDSMSGVNAAGIAAVKTSNSWNVINLNSGSIARMPNGCEFYQSLNAGVVFEKDDGFNYTYVCVDYSQGDFMTLDSTLEPPKEKNDGDFTFVSYRDVNNERCNVVLLTSNNEVIASGIESYKKIGNAYQRDLYALKHLDGTTTIVKKDGTEVTSYPVGNYELVDSFIKIGVWYKNNKSGYGILDSNGKVILPPVLPKDDVVIKNNSFLLCGTSCLNGNTVFASSDGWNVEVDSDDIVNLKEAMSVFSKKSDLKEFTIAPTSLKFRPNHMLVDATFKQTYRSVKEETFDGVTYEQPLLGYFKGLQDEAYVLARKNENLVPYLKIRDGEFNLAEFWSLLYGKNGNVSSISITPSMAQDVINAIYGESPRLEFKLLSYLSNGKAIVKLHSKEVIDTDTYISSSVWYSLGESTQKHLQNISNARARDLENTMQSNLIILDTEESKIDKIILLNSDFNPRYQEDYDVYVGDGDFYLFNTSYLARFNNSGELLWEFNERKDDYLYSFDVNDSNVIISGFNTTEKYDGKPNPMLVMLDKESGQIISRDVESYKIDGKVNPFWPHVVFVENGYVLQRNNRRYGQEYLEDGYVPMHLDIRKYDEESDVRFDTKFIKL